MKNKKSKNVDYIRIEIDHMVINFCKTGLSDSRGIGRVSHELLKQLTEISKSSCLKEKCSESYALKEVYFYSSIHYCPSSLPQPSIIMIHDVIPLLFPEEFSKKTLLKWANNFRIIAQNAQKIITISDSSAADICRVLDIPLERVSVIYNGVTQLPISSKLLTELPTTPYFIYVGSKNYHKNVDVVLKALTDPEMADVHLVMVGKNYKYSKWVKAYGLKKRVTFLGIISDEEMGIYLKHATALVFPSLYEGFGLPPLEAALLGTPSICSQRPAMLETLKDACLFVSPNDPSEWVSAMLRLKTEPIFRSQLGQAAKTKAEYFSWRKSANMLLTHLKSL